MGDESKVEVYKRLTLDLLGGVGVWLGFEDIVADFELNDGEIDQDALRVALDVLVAEGRLLHETRGEDDEYMSPPQEGDGDRGELASLRAEVERLRKALELSERDADALMERLAEPAPSDKAAAERSVCVEQESAGKAISLQSTPDNFIVLARGLGEYDADIIAGSVQNILESILSDHVAQFRAEQAEDRAAVRRLVEKIPGCMWDCAQPATGEDNCDGHQRVCDAHRCKRLNGAHFDQYDYAVPLRALLERMKAWSSEAKAPAHHAAAEDVPDDVQAGSLGLTFQEAARRYPEAFDRALGTVAGRADDIAARFDAADPKWHWLFEKLKRRYPKDASPTETRSAPRFIGEFGDGDEPSVGDVDGYARRG